MKNIFKFLKNKFKQPVLVIKLENENDVPILIYKGKQYEMIHDLNFSYLTKGERYKFGEYIKFNINYFDKTNERNHSMKSIGFRN